MLKLDYHTHSTFSDGQGTYTQVIDKAKELGLDEIAITDHFDKYELNEKTRSITDEQLLEHFSRIKEYAAKVGQKVICGIETCADYNGNLRLSDRVLRNCEIIITSVHYVEYEDEQIPGNYYDERYWESYKEKVLNTASGAGDILGHCEAYLPYGKLLIPNTTTYEQRKALSASVADRFFDMQYIDELVKRLKKSGKALELHCVTATPRESVIEKMVSGGIPLSLGSDAHELSAIGNTGWGVGILEKYGIDAWQASKVGRDNTQGR